MRHLGWLLVVVALGAPGVSCTQTTCPSAQVLRDGECRLSCNNASQCSVTESCVDGACQPGMTTTTSSGGVSVGGSSSTATGASGSSRASNSTQPSSGPTSSGPSSGDTSSSTVASSEASGGSSGVGFSSSTPGSSLGGPSSVVSAGSSQLGPSSSGASSSGATATSASASIGGMSSSAAVLLPSALRVQGPSTMVAGTCVMVTVTFTLLDGTPVTPPAGTVLSLSTSSPGAGFHNQDCSSAPLTSINFPPSPTVTFGARATVTGTTSFNATSGALSGSMGILVNPGPVVSLVPTPPNFRTRVGRCVPVTLNGVDLFGNTSPPTAVVVVASLDPAVALLSTSPACLAPTATVQSSPAASGPFMLYVWAAGAGSTVVNGSTTGAAAGSVAVDVVPGVVHGTCTLTSAQTLRDCPIPAWVVPDRTLILVSVAPSVSRAPEGIPLCTFPAQPGFLRCERREGNQDLGVAYQLVPLPEGVVVRRGSAACTQPSTQISIPGATGGFTLVGVYSDGGNFNASDVRTVTPTATGVTVAGNCSGGGVSFHAQQLDWPAATLQLGNSTMGTGASSVTTNFIGTQPPAQTLTSVTLRANGGAGDACNFTTLSTNSDATVASTRSGAFCSTEPVNLVVQRLGVPSGFTINTLALDLPNGTRDTSFMLGGFPEDVAVMAMDEGAGVQGMGMSNDDVAELRDMSTRLDVTAGTLRVSRSRGDGRLRATLQVLTLAPP